MKCYLSAFLLLCLASCTPKTGGKVSTRPVPPRPDPQKPGKYEPMDTLRWTPSQGGRPPVSDGGGIKPGEDKPLPGDAYTLAFLLPFLTHQAADNTVPEKSEAALQFYAGAKIALEQLSKETGLNLVVDVFDTQAGDADFQKLLLDRRLEKAQVFIGPFRPSHVTTFAEWCKNRRKILISPQTSNSELTSENPDFIQITPSLRAHCAAITRYVRQTHSTDAVTLVCREKEADRLSYFQEANAGLPGGGVFREIKVPDATTTFNGIDLKKYVKAGKTSVFILPSWAGQDFIMAFLRQLKSAKGNNRVEVYGMPQWRTYESVEPEYFTALNVHISATDYVDGNAEEVAEFERKFYENTGTIPEEEGYRGFDVTMMTGKMLARYGLSFPEKLGAKAWNGLLGFYDFQPVMTNPDAGRRQADYIENTAVRILKFGDAGFKEVD